MRLEFKTPFRYPGSKSSFTKVVKKYLEFNGLIGCNLYEPYAGSAAVTISLISDGICKSAVIGEKDPLLFSFWNVVFTNPDDLIQKISDVNVTLDTWHILQPLLKIQQLESHHNQVELALAAIFFNRTNFSGVLHSGPIGGQKQLSQYKIDCRFNRQTIIDKINGLRTLSDKINVVYGDALSMIDEYSNNKKAFFYVDPPYYVQGPSLYRHNYKLKDHIALSQSLTRAKFKWLLSYDSHHVIRSLYEKHNHVLTPFRYSTNSPKNEHELLITNLNIPPD